jgi:hypothetical protein
MKVITVLVSLGLLAACGSSANPVRPTPPPSTTSAPPVPPQPSITSIAPTSAIAGTSELTLHITGARFIEGFPVSTVAMWSAKGGDTILLTSFVSSSEVTAVVPAELLTAPETVRIWIENGDSMAISDGFNRYPRSNSVSFEVSAPTGTTTSEDK